MVDSMAGFRKRRKGAAWGARPVEEESAASYAFVPENARLGAPWALPAESRHGNGR
ncbi:hypothetical protein MPNT_240028 [Candidatus Methylacidithermus pantelleriae]|uniref:Uncharacterized protein n=2 Tax=Candidatus Methylacidithermus pantelleriae TaxID=2744239 RepID=A0A8J2BIM6_9BACT|nr:hypothetical protein MPNT_240028 [Candidatus Methylacidithermus pantelleriae]